MYFPKSFYRVFFLKHVSHGTVAMYTMGITIDTAEEKNGGEGVEFFQEFM